MAEAGVDRTRLPIRRPRFTGVTDKTLANSTPDWSQASPMKPPDGAPNVLFVLIDDAGFGNPSTFGGPIQTPNYARLADHGLQYNRFRVTAPAGRRGRHCWQRNHRRVGFGMVGEFSGPFPGSNATIPHDCAPFPRILQENGYLTGGFGEWHLTPDNQPGYSGPTRQWADAPGFRLLLGVPRRRGRPVRTADHREPEDRRCPRVEGRGEVLLSGRPRREDDRLDSPGAVGEAEDAVVCTMSQPAAVMRRITCRVVVDSTPGRSTRAGRDARGDDRPSEGARRRSRRCRVAPAQRRVSRVGFTRRDAQASVCAADGGLRRLLRERGLEHRSDHRSDGRAAASSRTPSSCGSGATTARAWKARSPARSTSSRP